MAEILDQKNPVFFCKKGVLCPLEMPPVRRTLPRKRCSRSHGRRSRAAPLGGLGLLARHQVARAAVAASARSLGAHDGRRGRRPGRLRQVDRRLRQGRTAAAAAVPRAALAASRTAPAPLPRQPRTGCTPPASRSVTPASASRPAQVVVFSKTTCPFCRKTKDLFDGLDVKYTAVELGDFNPHPKP